MVKYRQFNLKNLNKKGQTESDEEIEDLEQKLKEMEMKVKEKQKELFELEKVKYRCKIKVVKQEETPFVQLEEIALKNKIEKMEQNLEIMAILSGMEVVSFEKEDHLSIVFHVQHKTDNPIQHSIMIDMSKDEKPIVKASLPLGFNLSNVMRNFDSNVNVDFVKTMRESLDAYYNRLVQYQHLKTMLGNEAHFFKFSDTTHVEITFTVCNDRDPDEESIQVILVLDYMVNDIKPSSCYFKDTEDIPDYVREALEEQCKVFHVKPLYKAFKRAFITGVGQYKMVQQMFPTTPVARRRRRRPRAPQPRHCNNDDTFRPEDCSDTGDDCEMDA